MHGSRRATVRSLTMALTASLVRGTASTAVCWSRTRDARKAVGSRPNQALYSEHPQRAWYEESKAHCTMGTKCSQSVTALRYSTSKAFNTRRFPSRMFSTAPLVQGEFATAKRRFTPRRVVSLAGRRFFKWMAVSPIEADWTHRVVHQRCNPAAAFSTLAAEADSYI